MFQREGKQMSDLISRKALIESLKGVEIEQWLNDDGTLSDDYYHTTVVDRKSVV